MNKKRWIFLICILSLVIASVCFLGFKVLNNKAYPIIKIQTISKDSDDTKKSNSNNLSTYDVLSNGKLREASSFSTNKSAEKVTVDPTIFDDYIKDRQVHLRIIKRPKLVNQYNQKITDPNYWKLIESIVKNVHSGLYRLTLFKIDSKHYYAFFEINQGIIDGGTLYSYNPKDDKLIKLIDIDRKIVVNAGKY